MGGNERLAALGKAPGGGRASDSGGPGAMVFAQEAVLAAVSAPSGQKALLPVGAWPTESYPDWKELSLNNEAIQVFHVPAAHTDGDSLVFFRRSDVVVTGDIFVTTTYPVIDKGGSINGVIDGLNRIIEITIPKDWQEGGTMVIPGHGRICDEADVVEYRDMVTIIRDRIQDSIKKGMTLDQVKAARPTLEYDSRYGSDSGPWTTSMFIEAVYRSLTEMSIRIAAIALLMLVMAAPAAPQAPAAPSTAGSSTSQNSEGGCPNRLTGNWVSVVTEDWRWRMLIPKKGDYTSVPLSAGGTQGGRYVGPIHVGQRRVQSLWRGGAHARAGAAPDQLGE